MDKNKGVSAEQSAAAAAASANTRATITVDTAGSAAVPFQIPIKGIDKALAFARR